MTAYEIEKQLGLEYEKLKPFLTKWGQFVDVELNSILKSCCLGAEIKSYPEFNLKDTQRFIRKALYRKKNYDNPILNITDKVRTRIVVDTGSKLDKIRDAILQSDKWKSKVDKDIKNDIEEKPKEFDYQSIHIIVRPNKSMEFFENSDYELFSCEIQIRSELQNTFAEFCHENVYHGLYKNDNKILRKLSKAMALMESTDDILCDIEENMKNQERKYENFLKELVKIYRDIKPDFNTSDIDPELTDDLFSILKFKNIDIEKINQFYYKNKSDIDKNIKQNKGFIFNQPVILLIAFIINYDSDFLRDDNHWPLSQIVLEDVFHGFGYSYERY